MPRKKDPPPVDARAYAYAPVCRTIKTIVQIGALQREVLEGHPCMCRRDEAGRLALTKLHASIRFMWNVHRCGIYVRLGTRCVEKFVPFVNVSFRQSWGEHLQGRKALSSIRQRAKGSSARHGTRAFVHVPLSGVWTNGPLLCTRFSKKEPWGSHHLPELFQFVRGLSASVPKRSYVEFFLNKRDGPLHSNDPRRHPSLWLPPQAHDHHRQWTLRCGIHVPVLSFYGGPQWRDRLIPSPEDLQWMLSPPDVKYQASVPWNDKCGVALFRGSSTGQGITAKDNARIHLCSLEPCSWLDAKLTGHNSRFRVCRDGIVRAPPSASRKARQEARQYFMPLQEQEKFKYIVYVDGHAASSRLGTMLRMGSVTLRVAPRQGVASETWIDVMGLRGAMIDPSGACVAKGHNVVDRVRTHRGGVCVAIHDAQFLWISEDLRNLKATVMWLRAHDTQAHGIAKRGQLFIHHVMDPRVCYAVLSQSLASCCRPRRGENVVTVSEERTIERRGKEGTRQ